MVFQILSGVQHCGPGCAFHRFSIRLVGVSNSDALIVIDGSPILDDQRPKVFAKQLASRTTADTVGVGGSGRGIPVVIPHLGQLCRRTSWRQNGKHTRHKKQRKHIAPKMPHVLRVRHRLHRHDAAVNNAGPHREPDET